MPGPPVEQQSLLLIEFTRINRLNEWFSAFPAFTVHKHSITLLSTHKSHRLSPWLHRCRAASCQETCWNCSAGSLRILLRLHHKIPLTKGLLRVWQPFIHLSFSFAAMQPRGILCVLWKEKKKIFYFWFILCNVCSYVFIIWDDLHSFKGIQFWKKQKHKKHSLLSL